MDAKIQADEISSIIKERIDNFELNVDVETSCIKNRRDMVVCIVQMTPFERGILQEVEIFGNLTLGYNVEVFSQKRLQKNVLEQINIEELVCTEVIKELRPKDWYRKFEKKKRY